jgi:hypothetical protein
MCGSEVDADPATEDDCVTILSRASGIGDVLQVGLEEH